MSHQKACSNFLYCAVVWTEHPDTCYERQDDNLVPGCQSNTIPRNVGTRSRTAINEGRPYVKIPEIHDDARYINDEAHNDGP
jgi:hypothetical protein